MASDYPFRRIVGVELLPSLHQIAQQNSETVQERFAEMLRARIALRRCYGLPVSR